ncbi:MAG: FtsX-like permease family protein, partial [Chitinivibrionales bacterium]|nr:FtsX-like permease family protein [Chitinivibrionales bacterium]
NLKDAQRLLGFEGRINEIRAVESLQSPATLPDIAREVSKVLPGTIVVNRAVESNTRARAIRAAITAAETAIDGERESHRRMTERRGALTAGLIVLVVVGCGLIVGLLAMSNVRDRRDEIAVLRALGTGRATLFSLFTMRSVLAGLCGGAAGSMTALVISRLLFATPDITFGLIVSAAAVAAGIVVAAVAAVPPAFRAAGQDPASIFGRE